jgi:GSH-dependent disulfide-bond oxidoreductase
MIDVYYWPTPNGHKITMFLEEAGIEYALKRVNIGKGDQFATDFLEIAPNNRIPAIVDHHPADAGAPISIFESGAILQYLAEKYGRFMPTSLRERVAVTQWLFWQMAGLGPMAGQNHHFNRYAPEKIPYAIERYERETRRLYAVLDKQLGSRPFVAGDSYSIADMAVYPWIVPYRAQHQVLEDTPALKRWFESIRARPATERAYARGEQISPPDQPLSEEARRNLFTRPLT